MVIITSPFRQVSNHENNGIKSIKGMVGDFFREVASLVFVFPILEKIIFARLPFWWIFWTLIVAIGALILGISLERSQSK